MNSLVKSISTLVIIWLFSVVVQPGYLYAAKEYQFIDEDGDLLADLPADESNWLDPETLVICIIPEPEAEKNKLDYDPLLAKHIEKVIGRPVELIKLNSWVQQIRAMQKGDLHVSGFSTGTTVFAVNLAGYIPVVSKGKNNNIMGYSLQVITNTSTDILILPDLKGKRVAHTSTTSNSGNLAPRVLLPPLGLTPEIDYEVVFSGGHSKSINGVAQGLYDGAAIASSVLYRMVENEEVNNKDIRVLYTSPTFPTLSIGHVNNLHPELRDKVVKALNSFVIPKKLHKEYKGADRFVPINYKRDWEIVRLMATVNNVQYTEEALREMERKEKQ